MDVFECTYQLNRKVLDLPIIQDMSLDDSLRVAKRGELKVGVNISGVLPETLESVRQFRCLSVHDTPLSMTARSNKARSVAGIALHRVAQPVVCHRPNAH